MNGFRVNKGIVIELTALLDVILIMMFWLMMNVSENSEAIQTEADSRVAAADSRAEEAEERLEEERAELESAKEEAKASAAEAWLKAETAAGEAWQNKEALEGFENGDLVTLSLNYSDAGVLSISNGDGKLGETELGSALEIYSEIVASLKAAGVEKEDVVLCAFVYDGSVALYRDVQAVTTAMNDVGKSYKSFYCTYINTAR